MFKRFAMMAMAMGVFGACASTPEVAVEAEAPAVTAPVAEVAAEVAAKPATSAEELCRVSLPCANMQQTEEEVQACVDMLKDALEDVCLPAMAAMKNCAVAQMKCDAEGNVDEAATQAAMEGCAEAMQALAACCGEHEGSVVCK